MFSSTSMIVRPKHNNLKGFEEAVNQARGSANAIKQSIGPLKQGRSNRSRTHNFEINACDQRLLQIGMTLRQLLCCAGSDQPSSKHQYVQGPHDFYLDCIHLR